MPANKDKKAVKEALAVACPFCGAAIGRACHYRSNPAKWIATHKDRIRAFEATTKEKSVERPQTAS